MLYTLKEEIVNSITHGIGAALSIAALVLMIVFAVFNSATALDIVGYSIYGASLVILYTMSTLYHAITNEKAKKVLRIIDHSSVYLLIAGTYTPYCFSILNGIGPKSWVILSFVWLIAIFGTTMYCIFKEKVKILNVISYVIMGWAIALIFPDVKAVCEALQIMPCLYLLLAGGIAYTAGLIFYGLKKIKYFHSVWHVFVLGGSVLHYISIMIFIFVK